MEPTVYRCRKEQGEFVFSHGDSILCRVRGNHSSLWIEGSGFFCASLFDMDSTLCPGITKRKIFLHNTGEEAFLLWEGRQNYTLYFGEKTFWIRNNGFRYWLIGEDNSCLMTLFLEDFQSENPDFRIPPVPQCRMENVTQMTVLDVHERKTLMSILAAFPLLRFDFDLTSAMEAPEDGKKLKVES